VTDAPLTRRAPVVVAIFVGGRSSRMGGSPKGRLLAPGSDEPIVERSCRAARVIGAEPVLVGDAAPYEGLAEGVPRIADAPAGVGPLGGLAAALEHAGERPLIAVACDMPHVDAHVLSRLRDHPSRAAVLAPRRGPDAPFEPLLARYDAARVRPVVLGFVGRGGRSFQRLFAELDVEALDVDEALGRALVDWDAPDDMK
jgi:molybdopterin-guanine dinucleotide biosynthesis protein A